MKKLLLTPLLSPIYLSFVRGIETCLDLECKTPEALILMQINPLNTRKKACKLGEKIVVKECKI